MATDAEMMNWSLEEIERYAARMERKRAALLAKEDARIARVVALARKKGVQPLRSNSYSAWLLWWRAERGTWLFEAYGARGNGFALASARGRLAKLGYIDADGVPTDAGLAWVARHGEIAQYVADWRVVPDRVPLSRAERASVAAKASWSRLSPEERTARARKAGLVRGAQLSKRPD